MKLYIEGDKSKAVCEECGLVETTFQVREMPLSVSKGTVKNLLVGVCDKCDKIVSIPHQSTIKIKEHQEKALKPLEARIPLHYVDILNVACDSINDKASYGSLSTAIFRYYVHQLAKDKRRNKSLPKYTKSNLFKGKNNNRFSIKLNDYSLHDFNSLLEVTNLNKTDLLKSIILLINDDINNKKSEKNINFLREASYIL